MPRLTWVKSLATSGPLALGILLYSAAPARAQKPIIPSLEWHCARSHNVLLGKIIYVKDIRGRGKSHQLVWLLFQTQHGRVGIGTRVKNTRQLEQFKRAGTRLLLFYSQSIQGFGIRYPVDKIMYSVDKWIQLAHPVGQGKRRLYSRRNAVTKATGVAAFCHGIRKKLQRSIGSKGKLSSASATMDLRSKVRKGYFPVPGAHPLRKKVRCAKGCTLLVPKSLK